MLFWCRPGLWLLGQVLGVIFLIVVLASDVESDGSRTTTFPSKVSTEEMVEDATTDLLNTINDLVQDEPILFNSGEDSLTEESAMVLAGLADLIKADSGEDRIRIVGFTDSVGPSGPNQVLSEARARAVADYLVDEVGVDPGRLVIEGRGESALLLPELTEDARRKNRRIEFERVGPLLPQVIWRSDVPR